VHRSILGPLLCLAACSTQDAATIKLVTGEETDTFTQPPAPTTLRVDSVAPLDDGGSQTTTLATVNLPATSIDLGQQDESTVAAFAVSGFDGQGNIVLQGSSLPLAFSSIAGATIPVFVQRTGQFARLPLPMPLADTRQMPLLSIVQGETLFVAGGADPSLSLATELYDFTSLAAAPSPPTLTEAPASIALDGTVAWLIGSDAGTYFDLSDSYIGNITLPAGGGAFGDIAGGSTVIDDTGAEYVVGATRTSGAPSRWILKVDPNDATNANYQFGNATWIELVAGRLGASAAWVSGRGLVVAGGSTTAAGAEIIAAGSAASLALQVPPDGSVGSGAVALDGNRVLIAGGLLAGADAGVRVIDLSCSTPTCAPAPYSPGLPRAIASAQAFLLGGSTVVVVGSEPAAPPSTTAGLTHAYVVTSSQTLEVPTKVPHMNARAVASPLGGLVLFGGAGEIESFVP